MANRLNIFSKIIILICLLLVPILILYTVSNRISKHVIQDHLQSSNLNQLSFFLHQLDSRMDQLSMFPVILSKDPYIREFVEKRTSANYDILKEQSRLTEKLGLQSVSSEWRNDLTIALPKEERFVSSNIYQNFDESLIKGDVRTTWAYSKQHFDDRTQNYFQREIAEPATARTKEQAIAIFQVGFSTQNIVEMLDLYKNDKHSDPFLFHVNHEPILNSTSSAKIVDGLLPLLRSEPLSDNGQKILDIDHHQFLVSFAKSAQLGWYLIDYVPLQSIMAPITRSSEFFYISVGLLLMMSILASFLLYRNVQIPIGKLMGSVQRIKRGDFSARIDYHSHNEFDFLILRFNEMAEQIQLLVENVYAEKIRSREATLKQLQSQINPHFLYNSLFFMINSAKLDDQEAVVEMGENLASYYRYMTRVENQSVTVQEELEMVKHYLAIQNLRMQRLESIVDVPEEMMEAEIPRLILQPIVENAIIHGIEQSIGGGCIRITGEQDRERFRIIVEDNGMGMTPDDMRELETKLTLPMSEEIGCGTWNVHQRLIYQFGEGSGLSFHPSASGGLKVVISWNRQESRAVPKNLEE